MLSSSDEEHTCSYHQHDHIIVTTSRMQLFECITFLVFCWVEPTAMPQRLWEEEVRPQWAREQARRLGEGHFAQLRIHEDWCEEEREHRCWQEWEDSWAWDWAENRWTWADWSGGQWWWRGRRWWSQRPTALSHQNVASSSWEEDKDPATFNVDRVREDMGTHRLTALTPVSFQPQRHITMILGRPVIVHGWSKNIRAIL